MSTRDLNCLHVCVKKTIESGITLRRCYINISRSIYYHLCYTAPDYCQTNIKMSYKTSAAVYITTYAILCLIVVRRISRCHIYKISAAVYITTYAILCLIVVRRISRCHIYKISAAVYITTHAILRLIVVRRISK